MGSIELIHGLDSGFIWIRYGLYIGYKPFAISGVHVQIENTHLLKVYPTEWALYPVFSVTYNPISLADSDLVFDSCTFTQCCNSNNPDPATNVIPNVILVRFIPDFRAACIASGIPACHMTVVDCWSLQLLDKKFYQYET